MLFELISAASGATGFADECWSPGFIRSPRRSQQSIIYCWSCANLTDGPVAAAYSRSPGEMRRSGLSNSLRFQANRRHCRQPSRKCLPLPRLFLTARLTPPQFRRTQLILRSDIVMASFLLLTRFPIRSSTMTIPMTSHDDRPSCVMPCRRSRPAVSLLLLNDRAQFTDTMVVVWALAHTPTPARIVRKSRTVI